MTVGGSVLTNLSVAELYERALAEGEGTIAAEGSLVVLTGKHTGRSPKDKFVVREPSSQDKVWWGEVNHEISEANYDRLRARLMGYLKDRELYAQDLYIGAHEAHRRSLRVYTETAWASIFARNLFRIPPREALATFQPNFTIIDAPSFEADPATEGTRTGTAILAPPQADGDHRRRDEVRGRDQEVRVHGDELPDARRGRAADAQLDQRRRARRRVHLLRPQRDRENDPSARTRSAA